MRKMTKTEIDDIVVLIRRWQLAPLSWKHLRQEVSRVVLSNQTCWSRQALQANESINSAWLTARKRIALKGRRREGGGDSGRRETSQELESALEELQRKYDKLALRHRQLIYNASMLPGGTRLLLDPLPDNTTPQTEGTSPRRSRHR